MHGKMRFLEQQTNELSLEYQMATIFSEEASSHTIEWKESRLLDPDQGFSFSNWLEIFFWYVLGRFERHSEDLKERAKGVLYLHNNTSDHQ